jgi:siderophore synthetase component
VAALSPEFHATVPVRIAALRADMAYVERMPHVSGYLDWFAGQFPQVWTQWQAGLEARGLDPQAWLPLPIHSWHLDHFVRTEYAAEIEEGLLILDGPDIDTGPTMSFRTMLPQLDGTAPFIKLPIALWLTSEQRSLQAKSIHMGPRISTLIQRILADEHGFDGTLEIFPEEVALHYKHAVRQEDRPGRYLSVAYRASRDAFERSDGLFPVTVAALLTTAPGGRPLIAELIEQGNGVATAQTVETYFRQYARTVAHPVIGIYLLYGIALEAHQQNTTVLFAPDGTPRRLLIRDFGDGRTYAPLLNARGHTLKPYVHPGILPTVFDGDIEPVRAFVLDACFFCHLHEVALLLTQTYRLPDHRLWAILREETARAFDAHAARVDPALWQAERAAFLEQPWPTRSVLRMHLLQYADYRLQHHLPNPLLPAAREA